MLMLNNGRPVVSRSQFKLVVNLADKQEDALVIMPHKDGVFGFWNNGLFEPLFRDENDILDVAQALHNREGQLFLQRNKMQGQFEITIDLLRQILVKKVQGVIEPKIAPDTPWNYIRVAWAARMLAVQTLLTDVVGHESFISYSRKDSWIIGAISIGDVHTALDDDGAYDKKVVHYNIYKQVVDVGVILPKYLRKGYTTSTGIHRVSYTSYLNKFKCYVYRCGELVQATKKYPYGVVEEKVVANDPLLIKEAEIYNIDPRDYSTEELLEVVTYFHNHNWLDYVEAPYISWEAKAEAFEDLGMHFHAFVCRLMANNTMDVVEEPLSYLQSVVDEDEDEDDDEDEYDEIEEEE